MAGGVTVELEPWMTAVVPAALPEVTIEGDGSALVVAPPADTALIRARLEAAGVSRSDADAFFAQFA